MLKSAVVMPICGLLVGGSLLAGIAVHAMAAARLGALDADAAEAAVPAIGSPDPEADLAPVPIAQTAPDVAPPIDRADARAYGFVITAGGASYVQLSSDDEDTALAHGAIHLEDKDGAQIAWAPIADAHLPARLADWKGKQVVVDGTCHARVTGFAVIARLAGETGYASSDDHVGDHWTSDNVMRDGARVLAARLDHCGGTWARDAALPPAAVGTVLAPAAPSVIARARAQLLASPVGIAMDAEWALAGKTGDYRTSEELQIETQLAQHPATRETWLYVHAYVAGGCGGPNIDLLGVYRIGADGVPIEIEAATTELQSIDALVDVDGDGRFELRAMDGFVADPALLDARGQRLQASSVPYFGCPC